jgi:hypothetical protein
MTPEDCKHCPCFDGEDICEAMYNEYPFGKAVVPIPIANIAECKEVIRGKTVSYLNGEKHLCLNCVHMIGAEQSWNSAAKKHHFHGWCLKLDKMKWSAISECEHFQIKED